MSRKKKDHECSFIEFEKCVDIGDCQAIIWWSQCPYCNKETPKHGIKHYYCEPLNTIDLTEKEAEEYWKLPKIDHGKPFLNDDVVSL
jgi:hypothetical protein